MRLEVAEAAMKCGAVGLALVLSLSGFACTRPEPETPGGIGRDGAFEMDSEPERVHVGTLDINPSQIVNQQRGETSHEFETINPRTGREPTPNEDPLVLRRALSDAARSDADARIEQRIKSIDARIDAARSHLDEVAPENRAEAHDVMDRTLEDRRALEPERVSLARSPGSAWTASVVIVDSRLVALERELDQLERLMKR
jgi:hypothetical protein